MINLKEKLKHPVFEVIRDIGNTMKDAQIPMVASGLAYTTILSLIPLLAVSFAVFQAFGGLDKLFAILEPFLLDRLAGDVSDQVMTNIREMVGRVRATTIGATGFIALLVTSMSVLSSAEKAIQRIWKTEKGRPLFYRITSYWFLITLGPLALSVALGIITSANEGTPQMIAQYFPSGLGIFLLNTAIFTVIYKLAPNQTVHWIPALSGALFTAFFWNLARWGYSLYTHKFVSYDKIYGSLAAIPLILLWIYICWIVILAGAALAASLQKRVRL